MTGIYKYTNKINGNIYIGLSNDIKNVIINIYMIQDIQKELKLE